MRIALLVAVLALVLPTAAAAHNTSWYWNRYKAETALREDGVEYDGGYIDVTSARCYGRGDSMRSTIPGKPWPMYRHFRCHISGWDEYGDFGRYSILFHVRGKFAWAWSQ